MSARADVGEMRPGFRNGRRGIGSGVMWRRMAGWVLGAALLLGSPGAWAASILLVPLATPASVGGSFDVEIQVTGLGDGVAPTVKSFDLDVSFDPSIVSFLGATFASELGDPDTQSIYDALASGPGVVDLFQVSLLAPAVLDALQGDSIVLATLHFSADAEGTSALDFTQTLVGDGAGASLAPTPVGTSLVVVPEPSTALLVGCGLLALVRGGRGRRDRAAQGCAGDVR